MWLFEMKAFLNSLKEAVDAVYNIVLDPVDSLLFPFEEIKILMIKAVSFIFFPSKSLFFEEPNLLSSLFMNKWFSPNNKQPILSPILATVIPLMFSLMTLDRTLIQ